MKNTFGNNITVTIFGESHGPAVGAVIDGMPSGIKINSNFIKSSLTSENQRGRFLPPVLRVTVCRLSAVSLKDIPAVHQSAF